MAESQEIFDYDAAALEALATGLSTARFAEYLGTHGDAERAIQLYLWNARLSKAFLFPLQICEVVTRNAMDRAFSAKWGRDWVLAPPFQLNEHSALSHARTLQRLRGRAQRKGLPEPTPDDIVAALTFDFWSNLFRFEYEAELWSDGALLAAVFANLPVGRTRGQVQAMVAEVNDLRNRIAHHEPIHDRQDHGAALNLILEVIGFSCTVTRSWARRHSTVMNVVRSPPSAYSRLPGRSLGQANLRTPRLFAPTTPLTELVGFLGSARPAVALVANDGAPSGFVAASAQTLLTYTADNLDDGLIDFGEHTLADVLELTTIEVATIDHRATTGDAMALFYPPKGHPRADLLVVRDDMGPIGLLTRPDARF